MYPRMHGPWQRIETPSVFGWAVVAEEVLLPCNAVEWNVAAYHDGTRVFPVGPNLQRNDAAKDAEVRRILAVIA